MQAHVPRHPRPHRTVTEPDGSGSEQRTRLAEDRTVLAAERTYASWLRTGLAFLASGLAAQRVLHDVLPSLQLRVLATVLILCAVAAFGAATWRDATVRGRLPEPDISLLPRALTAGLAVLLVLVCLPAAITVWLG